MLIFPRAGRGALAAARAAAGRVRKMVFPRSLYHPGREMASPITLHTQPKVKTAA